MNETIYSHFCPPVILTAIDAGSEIMTVYNSGAPKDSHDSPAPSAVAFKRSNDLIMNRLQILWDYPVLSVDSKDISAEIHRQWPAYWLVNPLDSLTAFDSRNGDFTVSIALIQEGIPVLGIVFAPLSGTLYFGANGFGARKATMGITFRDREDLVMKLTDPEHSFPMLPMKPLVERPFTVVTDCAKLNVEMIDYIERLELDHGPAKCITADRSTALCRIAEGSADVFIGFSPTMNWETAPAHAIIEASGGCVHDRETDTPLRYDTGTLVNPYFIATKKDWTVNPQ